MFTDRSRSLEPRKCSSEQHDGCQNERMEGSQRDQRLDRELDHQESCLKEKVSLR